MKEGGFVSKIGASAGKILKILLNINFQIGKYHAHRAFPGAILRGNLHLLIHSLLL